jgi:hypothetical protein
LGSLSANGFYASEAVFVAIALLCAVMTYRRRHVGAVAMRYFAGALVALGCMALLVVFEVRMTGGI